MRPSVGPAGLGRLLAMLDSQHWLIWTSRPAPLKAGLRRVQRERGSERFPAPGEVLVDAGDLDLAEKTLILFRHAKDHGADEARARNLVRSDGVVDRRAPAFHARADPPVRDRPARAAGEALSLTGQVGCSAVAGARACHPDRGDAHLV